MATRSWMTGVGCALAFLAPVGASAAEGDQLRATVGKPAIVTVAPARALPDQPRAVITVTGFRPPAPRGDVQPSVRAVVKVQKPDGTDQEVGSFTPFPQAEFSTDASGARRFSIPLPKEIAAAGPVTLKVELIPSPGESGAGAHLEVGSAEIQ
jgi:hypothetical protein